MSFAQLAGNARLKENLSAALSRGHISHFYLLCGSEESGKHTLARLLAAAILCENGDKPCCKCASCRKVLAGTHPDVITVDDPEKKTVTVDMVRQARSDVYIRPNEGSHKIYLIPRAHTMLDPAQNALLKVLEEPPQYGVFLLLSDTPEKLLPTVRSRCTCLVLEEPEQQGKVSPQTEKFFDAYCKADPVALLECLTPLEKWKRDQLIALLQQWVAVLTGALRCASGAGGDTWHARQIAAAVTAPELARAVDEIKKCTEYLQGNVSPAAVCGYLTFALRT